MSETVVTISAKGATNSQIVSVMHAIASTAGTYGTLTTGVGLSTTNVFNVGRWNSGDLTKDMTASQAFSVTLTLSTNLTTLEWKSYDSTLELLNL